MPPRTAPPLRPPTTKAPPATVPVSAILPRSLATSVEDEEITRLLAHAPTFSFTPLEQRALALWDQLERERVEIGIWTERSASLQSHSHTRHPHQPSATTETQIEKMKQKVLESIVEYKSHRRITDSVFSRLAIEQSVGLMPESVGITQSQSQYPPFSTSTPTTPARRRAGGSPAPDPLISNMYLPALASLIRHRDSLSLVHTQLLTDLAKVEGCLAGERSEGLVLMDGLGQAGGSGEDLRAQGGPLGLGAAGEDARRRKDSRNVRDRDILFEIVEGGATIAAAAPDTRKAKQKNRKQKRKHGDDDGDDDDDVEGVTEEAKGVWTHGETVREELAATKKEVMVMREVLARLVGESGVEWVKEGLLSVLLMDEDEDDGSDWSDGEGRANDSDTTQRDGSDDDGREDGNGGPDEDDDEDDHQQTHTLPIRQTQRTVKRER